MLNRTIAILLSFLLLPIFIICSIFIAIIDGFPILFIQKRSGQYNTFFSIYKFRTMKIGTPNIATDKLLDKPFYFGGQLLRKLSIDEFPQLINIIRGDMNFIGPRPALYNQHHLIQKRKDLGISNIKPGITGWAQVNGRDKISEEEKIQLDSYYLKNKSFMLDISILLRTFLKVISIKDIN